MKIRLKRDDGAVVYLNGDEVLRSNLPAPYTLNGKDQSAGKIKSNTKALKVIGGGAESAYVESIISTSKLRSGTNANVLAVEIHQHSASSSDISFDLELKPIDNPPKHVVFISVDGLRPEGITENPQSLPSFSFLQQKGAYTYNARTDFDLTFTLPNHVSMLTSRPVFGSSGHDVDYNNGGDHRKPATIHDTTSEDYIASVFDTVHDHGFRTGMFVGKTRFDILRRSWNEDRGAKHGQPDDTGSDNGVNKIDVYDRVERNRANGSSGLVGRYINAMKKSPYHFSFVHFHDPDTTGHAQDWLSASYMQAVKKVDGLLGDILDLVRNNPVLKGRTYVILTADHGGVGGTGDHKDDPGDRENYTIPFFIWGPGVASGHRAL